MSHSFSVLRTYFVFFAYILFTFCYEVIAAGVNGKLSKFFLASWKKSCNNLSCWNAISIKRAIIDFRTMVVSSYAPNHLVNDPILSSENPSSEARSDDCFLALDDSSKSDGSPSSEDETTSSLLDLDELWQWSLEDLRQHSLHDTEVHQSHFGHSPHIFQGLINLLQKAHWGCKSFFSLSSYGHTGVQVSVVNNELVVGFRGTATIFDLLTDLRIGVEKGPHSIRAHKGFMKALNSVDHMAKLTDKILRMAQEHKVKRIVCTGYSLGGAVAALYHLKNGEALMQKGFDVRCITFGCPRFIDERDVGLLPLHLTSRIVHTYAEGDPIPLSLTSFLPWRRFKFSHVGHSVVLGERGRTGGVVSASSWRENDSRVRWWNLGCSTWSHHLTENYARFLNQAERTAQFNTLVQSAVHATLGFGRRFSSNVGGLANIGSQSPRSPHASAIAMASPHSNHNRVAMNEGIHVVDHVEAAPPLAKDRKILSSDSITLTMKRTGSHPSQIDSLAPLRRRVTVNSSPRPL